MALNRHKNEKCLKNVLKRIKKLNKEKTKEKMFIKKADES